MTVLDGFAEYQTFRGREATEDETRGSGDEPAVWMVRAGRGGIYAPAFIEHGAVIVGWGATGTIEDLSRQEISDHVRDAFPDYGGTKLASAAGVLRRLAGVMAEGDLALTPEPATKTILFGRIDGPYQFLSESIDPATDYQHIRPVRWFARVGRDELSYGARNSLGSMLTLSQPGHAGELQQVASAHADDAPPAPLAQRRGRRADPEPVTNASRSHPLRPSEDGGRSASSTRTRFASPAFSTGCIPETSRSRTSSGALYRPQRPRVSFLCRSCARSPLVHCSFSRAAGRPFKARAGRGHPGDMLGHPQQLVLDGQQRLTSLYQAIYGVGPSRFFLDIGRSSPGLTSMTPSRCSP